jgi:hypothetical protein
VNRHFIGQQEPRAEQGGLRAEGEHGRDSSSVANPTSCNHRYRCHGVDDRRHQRERCHATPDVPAGLPTLRHDDVHATSDCAPRFLDTADRVHDKPSAVMHQLDIVLGLAPEERHDPQSSVEGLIDSMVLIEGENEVAGERPVGKGRRFPNYGCGIVGPPQPQGAEAACI